MILLGFLSLAVIIAQVVALVLLGFAPVALVVGIFPGFGHAFFRAWLGKLATAVFVKALYSLVLAIVVAVSAALAGATGSLGFLFAFGLQTIFFWAIFLYRKQLSGRLISATTGGGRQTTTVVHRGAEIASKPFSALAGFALGRASDRDGKQENALAPAEGVSGDGAATQSAACSNGRAPASASSNGYAPVTAGPKRRRVGAARAECAERSCARTRGDERARPGPAGAAGVQRARHAVAYARSRRLFPRSRADSGAVRAPRSAGSSAASRIPDKRTVRVCAWHTRRGRAKRRSCAAPGPREEPGP